MANLQRVDELPSRRHEQNLVTLILPNVRHPQLSRSFRRQGPNILRPPALSPPRDHSALSLQRPHHIQPAYREANVVILSEAKLLESPDSVRDQARRLTFDRFLERRPKAVIRDI
jgi:hypothetical protein